jgi:protein ImuA
MRFVTCHKGLLQTLAAQPDLRGPRRGFTTGVASLDGLPPGGAFARGAVHEALTDPACGPLPWSFALLLARAAAVGGEGGGGTVVWSDPADNLYPPALAAGGLDLDRLLILRPASPREEVWAVGECLRCPGVVAVVAAPRSLARVEARRLQLAAERGGGVGILLRAWGQGGRADHYAAVTRWMVAPTSGDAAVQRWDVQLIHGHGGRVGSSVVLEACRETNHVRAAEQLAGRPAATTASSRRATA